MLYGAVRYRPVLDRWVCATLLVLHLRDGTVFGLRASSDRPPVQKCQSRQLPGLLIAADFTILPTSTLS